jgi:hypothetical protein
MVLGMSVKLMNALETRQMFGNDEIFQNLIKETGIDPKALEITYGGAGSAGFTELGSAMSAEFKGAAREVTTVTPKTRILTPGGSYFTFYVTDGSTITTRYCWFSKYEVYTVLVTKTQAQITTGTYFTYTDSQGSPTSYYVWMDKNGDGVTDDPGASGTGVACNISAATTAADVATIIATAINGLIGTGASAVSETVTVTMATKGDPTDAVDVDTTFTINVTENGGADPSATGTGAECDIKAATTASDVGTIIAAVLTALANITVTGTTTILMENDVAHGVTATTDYDTTYTIVRTQISADDHGGAPVYLVSASADDTDNIAKDMRKVNIIGFTATELISEEKALSGTTRVKSTELLWKRIIHYGGSDWGSAGQDAKGNISMQDIDGTATYLVITAAGNESEGGVIWIPNNFHAMIAEMSLDLHDIAIAAVTDGAVVKFIKSGLDETKNNRIYNTDPDHPNIPITATLGKPHNKIKWPQKSQMHGSDVAKLTIQEALVTTTVDFVFKAYVLIWYKAN